MVQLEIQASDGHELFTTLLCLDTSFMMTPCVIPNSISGFEAQSRKPSTGGLEAQPTKLLWRSVSTTPPPWSRCVSPSVLDHPITKFSNASAWLGQPQSWLGEHNLLLHMYTCLLMSPGLSYPWSVSQSLVPRSKPLVHPDLLHIHRLSLCSTPTHHKPRNMLHKHHTHAMVCIQTQPKLDHLLTITRHQSTNMGTYQPYVRSKHSETNCGTITNTSELLISGRLLMPLCLPFVTP